MLDAQMQEQLGPSTGQICVGRSGLACKDQKEQCIAERPVRLCGIVEALEPAGRGGMLASRTHMAAAAAVV